MSKGKDTKPHIGIFGRRNNGKSSLINALAGQELAIVSEVAGTTTDPVKKTMEIPGIGPVILIDTAGIDDVGDLGSKRVAKTREALKTIDLGILVITNKLFHFSLFTIKKTCIRWMKPFARISHPNTRFR
jgi:small GTP-binding protein